MHSARPPTVESAGLIEALGQVNASRRAARPSRAPRNDLERVLEAVFGPSRRLAAYGSLMPGELNHERVTALGGTWHDGHVRGDWSPTGWGATLGFPAIRWRPDGERVPVMLLVSDDLPAAWGRLDRFEGDEYCRILVPVYDDAGLLAVANLYEARTPPGGW